MTWTQRHRWRARLASSLWVAPGVAMLLALPVVRVLYALDARLGLQLYGFGPQGARALMGVLVGATLSFIVFVFSVLLVAVQIASTQLSPRVIGSFLSDRLSKVVLSIFVFTVVFNTGTMARIEDTVPQLLVVIAVVLTATSILAFLSLIDHVARSLRPSSVIARVAVQGRAMIERCYPTLLATNPETGPSPEVARLGDPTQVVASNDAGVLLAFDPEGLVNLARRTETVLVLRPQVGDFIGRGEPLLHVFGTKRPIDEKLIHDSVALGSQRTLEQDPEFAVRIIVEIALKAVSPAINDPSTAVLAIDQLQRLLHAAGERRLDSGEMRDASGALRLVYRTPDWEDLVGLAVAEIRLFGAASLQVMRRLRAMLDELLRTLPASRHPALSLERDALSRAVERTFPDAADRARARVADAQGMGGTE